MGTFVNAAATGGRVDVGGGFAARVAYAGDVGSSSLTGGNDIVLYDFKANEKPGTMFLIR